MEYNLYQDFALNIPRPAPPTGRPRPAGRAQSGRTPEFGYWPQVMSALNIHHIT